MIKVSRPSADSTNTIHLCDMLVYSVLLLSVAVSTSVSASKAYSINQNGTAFDITVNSITIFHHDPTNPMLFIGQGKTVFVEGLGNFYIENLIQERIALTQYNVSTGVSHDVIQFSTGIYKVNMILESTAIHSLVLSFENIGMDYSYAWLRTVAEQDEFVYGGGEQFSHFNLRERSYSGLPALSVLRAADQKYPMWTREQGVGRNFSNQITFFANQQGAGGAFHTTYYPQPSIISSRKYYMHYQGYNYVVLDFSVPYYHEIFIKGAVQKFFIKTDSSINNLVKGLSAFLGRMPALPDWVISGITLGVQGGTDVMMKRLKDAEASGLHVNALWIQDWSGDIHTSFGKRVFWDWKLNTTLYNNWNKTMTDLTKKGIKVLAYVNPNLNSNGDLFKEGDTKGYLIKNSAGNTHRTNFGGFTCGTVDFTNPNAFNWYKNTILKRNMIDIGLGGWMADFGEYLSASQSLTFHNGQLGELLHNQWPVLWAKMNREAVEESNKLGDIIFFMRSGYSGISNFTTFFWAGDQDVDFGHADGLPSTVPAALSAGVSGIGFTHYDIGGYTTFGSMGLKRTPELLIRSGEIAVFTPYMRSHEGNQPEANIQVYSNASMLKQFVRLTNMHDMLFNYTKYVLNDYIANGIPAQRPLFFEDESDTTAKNIKFQYMYGPDLIVAPALSAGEFNKSAYLPTGTWIHIWSGKEFTGKRHVIVESKLGEPAVFYRKGSRFTNTFQNIGKLKAIPLPKIPTQAASTVNVNTCLIFGMIYMAKFSINLFADYV